MVRRKPQPLFEEQALRAKQHRGELETFQNQHVHIIRRLPLYSELLTRLGPVAARELTRCDEGHQPEGAFRELWLRYHAPTSLVLQSSVALTRERSRARRNCDDDTLQGEAGKARGDIDDCVIGGGGDDALGLSFEREVETVERALWRRQVLGVERGLQVQRCRSRARSRLQHLWHTTTTI